MVRGFLITSERICARLTRLRYILLKLEKIAYYRIHV